jgi:hypothetical protein
VSQLGAAPEAEPWLLPDGLRFGWAIFSSPERPEQRLNVEESLLIVELWDNGIMSQEVMFLPDK